MLRHRQGGHGGKRAQLSAEQLTELKEKASAGEIRSIWDGVQWAQERYGVTYTYWGMRWVFARLNLWRKIPRPRNPQASSEQQAAWKKGGSEPR